MVQVMSWGDRGSHCKLNSSCPPVWPNPNTPHVQACLCGLIAGWHPGCLTWACTDDVSKLEIAKRWKTMQELQWYGRLVDAGQGRTLGSARGSQRTQKSRASEL